MNWSPRMLSVLRIMTGALFLEHGTQKLFGFPPAVNGGPALLSLLGIQGAIELAGGLLILLGLITRPVAFVLAGDMAVAYFMSHAPRAFFPVLNAGDATILYCFIFFSIWPSPEQDRGASTPTAATSDRPRSIHDKGHMRFFTSVVVRSSRDYAGRVWCWSRQE
jgi:putative oxidoreductase